MDEFPSHHFDATVKFNKKSTCAISLSHERSFNFLSRSITTRCSSVTNRELLHDCYQSIVYWLPLAPLFVVWFALQYRVRLYVQLRIPEARKNIISWKRECISIENFLILKISQNAALWDFFINCELKRWMLVHKFFEFIE